MLADPIASGEVMSAAELKRVREEEGMATKAFEAAVADEMNHQ